MFRSSALVLFTLAIAIAHAVPLEKRIAQVISDSTKKWEAACDAAGGGEQCNPLAVTSFDTLLAGAGNCDQQNAADKMVDLAKTLNSDPNMIKFAQIFAQQPRNSPNSVSVPYCQQAPKNAELNGLFQCQFDGTSKTTFVGNLAVGAPGTIPFGASSPVNPPGSCPASPNGGVTDGAQLTDTVQDPGNVGGNSTPGSAAGNGVGNISTSSVPISAVPSSTSSVPIGAVSSSTYSVSTGAVPSSTPGAGPYAGGSDGSGTPAASNAGAQGGTPSSAVPSPSSASGSFHLQNGKDAQALNAKFAGLTADSACTGSEQACVNGGFGQCVAGKFSVTPCSGGLTCAALPLVNKPGTSVTCDTTADALARISNTGATGGLTGSGN